MFVRQKIGLMMEKPYNLQFAMGIWVSTFRENDKLGDAPRALYKNLFFILYIEHYHNDMRLAQNGSDRFKAPATVNKLAEKAGSILSLCNRSGEGWMLTAN